ncbi:MAG TPA: insulinase family protein [Bacillota bacterium]|nr:insulinase family protein [Bacillota bacterium]
MSRAEIMDYRSRFYTPDNACLAVAGNVDFEEVKAQAGRLWAALSGSVRPSEKKMPRVLKHTAVRRKDTEQVHLCIGAHGLDRKDEQKYVALVLDSILGGSVSSRLFQELREERGLVYSTGTHHASYRDTGLFSIYAGTSMNNLSDVITIIQEQLREICRTKVGVEELTRAKEQLKGNLWLSLENTSNRMSRQNQLFGRKYRLGNALYLLGSNFLHLGDDILR